MALQDKIGTAKKISELLNTFIKYGDFRLKYRITVDPPMGENRDWEKPEILVEFSGSDSALLLERGGELLRSFECIVMEAVRLAPDEHEKVAFDCMNFRRTRLEELRMAAGVAAEKVIETGRPYPFQPMSSRERRILHLALRDHPDLRTESEGEGPQRHLVVYPKNYKGKAAAAPMRRRR